MIERKAFIARVALPPTEHDEYAGHAFGKVLQDFPFRGRWVMHFDISGLQGVKALVFYRNASLKKEAGEGIPGAGCTCITSLQYSSLE